MPVTTQPPPALAALPTMIPPNRIEFGAATARLGRVSHALLAAVLASPTLAVSVARAGRVVWGEPDVPANRLGVAVHRANAVLAELGCKRVLGVDRGQVVLV